jgi:hypothetical protein
LREATSLGLHTVIGFRVALFLALVEHSERALAVPWTMLPGTNILSISSINSIQTSSLSSGVPVPRGTQYVCARRVDSSTVVFSLSSHRHSYIGLVFASRFIDS